MTDQNWRTETTSRSFFIKSSTLMGSRHSALLSFPAFFRRKSFKYSCSTGKTLGIKHQKFMDTLASRSSVFWSVTLYFLPSGRHTCHSNRPRWWHRTAREPYPPCSSMIGSIERKSVSTILRIAIAVNVNGILCSPSALIAVLYLNNRWDFVNKLNVWKMGLLCIECYSCQILS